MINKLKSSHKKQLKLSDRTAVQSAISKLFRYFRFDRWIGTNNTFRNKQPKGVVNHKHFSEYVGASAPIHCADGWSFLGRALDSLVHGDSDIVRHLGYYAELRAAMSLLASEGICVFNYNHGILDKNGKCHKIKNFSTHKFTWLALDYWASLKRSTDLLAQIIQPGSIPLQDWFDAFNSGRTWQPIGRKWLKSWGLDLYRLSRDRDARNEASYRPTHIDTPVNMSVIESSEFLTGLWMLWEPSPPSRFEILDRYLLRLSLEEAFTAIHGTRAIDSPDFEREVVDMIERVNPIGISQDQLKQFLLRKIQPDDSILTTEARGNASIRDPKHHIQVISRSVLLLRVATGASAALLREAEIGQDDLEFWWKNIGEERGLWDPQLIPDEMVDLWADIEVSIGNLRDWETRTGANNTSYAHWRREHSNSISILGECERVALWGLGL